MSVKFTPEETKKRFEDLMAYIVKTCKDDDENPIGYFMHVGDVELITKSLDKKSVGDWMQEVHQEARDKGWWDADKIKRVGESLMLIVTELAEAMEEIRNNHKPGEIYYSGKVKLELTKTMKQTIEVTNITPTAMFHNDQHIIIKKPEGFAVELIDAVFRIFDILAFFGIDFDEVARIKLDYNKTRPKYHGGKAL